MTETNEKRERGREKTRPHQPTARPLCLMNLATGMCHFEVFWRGCMVYILIVRLPKVVQSLCEDCGRNMNCEENLLTLSLFFSLPLSFAHDRKSSLCWAYKISVNCLSFFLCQSTLGLVVTQRSCHNGCNTVTKRFWVISYTIFCFAFAQDLTITLFVG